MWLQTKECLLDLTNTYIYFDMFSLKIVFPSNDFVNFGIDFKKISPEDLLEKIKMGIIKNVRMISIVEYEKPIINTERLTKK